VIVIRRYVENDAKLLWEIFFNTVRCVNSRDYSLEQVKAWAPESIDFDAWGKRMNGIDPFIAEIDGLIVGYADLQDSGLIDHFYCHHEYQGQGVGRALINHLFSIGRKRGIKRCYSHVSITAKPFYAHFGFSVHHEQQVDVRGQKLTNYLMEKSLK